MEIIFLRTGETSVGNDDGKGEGVCIEDRITERQRVCKLGTVGL